MVFKQVACTTDQLVAKEVPTMVADLLDDSLQCTYKKARTGILFVVYNVVGQIQFHLLLREVMNEILDEHIAEYFDPSDTAGKVSEQLPSTNTSMALIAAFIQRRTSEAVAVECVSKNMEEQLRLQAVDADAKHVMQKSVSPPSRTDLAPSNSPSDKNKETKANKCCPGHRSGSRRRHRSQRKNEKHLSASTRSANSKESPSDSNSDTYSICSLIPRAHRSDDDGPRVLRSVSNLFRNALDYHNYRCADKLFRYDERVAKSVARWANDYKYK